MAILRSYLKGDSFESLDKDQQDEVLAATHAKHDRSIHRKIELCVIAYHLPGLATQRIFTRKSSSPVYYYTVTMGFWFGVVFGVMKLLGKI